MSGILDCVAKLAPVKIFFNWCSYVITVECVSLSVSKYKWEKLLDIVVKHVSLTPPHPHPGFCELMCWSEQFSPANQKINDSVN